MLTSHNPAHTAQRTILTVGDALSLSLILLLMPITHGIWMVVCHLGMASVATGKFNFLLEETVG
jgi:hypothetical protein